MPPEWYAEPHSFPEKNSVWERVSLELSVSASRRALEQADVAPNEVGTVILASTTGLATPSLDPLLIKELDLARSAARLPVEYSTLSPSAVAGWGRSDKWRSLQGGNAAQT